MGVSINRGTPKSSILFSDFPLQSMQLLGYPHDYGNPHIFPVRFDISIYFL